MEVSLRQGSLTRSQSRAIRLDFEIAEQPRDSVVKDIFESPYDPLKAFLAVQHRWRPEIQLDRCCNERLDNNMPFGYTHRILSSYVCGQRHGLLFLPVRLFRIFLSGFRAVGGLQSVDQI